jgi:acetyl-CoA carboxylase biotin carboxyl carrier protein
MRLSYIKKLIKLVEESDISTLEIARWGRSVRIEKPNPNSRGNNNSGDISVTTRNISIPMSAEHGGSREAVLEQKPPAEKKEKKYSTEAAPMVGTFYRAPSPDAPPYVEVGDVVSKGQVLCIIEAMKLMNEIQSEFDGTVRKILVENAQPVEYGQELFLIEP